MKVAPKYSFEALTSAMRTRKVVRLMSADGKYHTGMVNSVSIEDGSGKNFLIRLSNVERTIFVRAE